LAPDVLATLTEVPIRQGFPLLGWAPKGLRALLLRAPPFLASMLALGKIMGCTKDVTYIAMVTIWRHITGYIFGRSFNIGRKNHGN
jgi:uncharacterized membrane protein YraQ (UPF0718 family)